MKIRRTEDGVPVEIDGHDGLREWAIGGVGSTVLSLYRRPALTNTVAIGVDLAIRYERLLRHGLGGSRKRPHINWHEGGFGPALVLINGFTGSGIAWPTAWIAQLEKRFRVIRVDNRGTGWSRNAPMPFTISDMADDIADVLVACGVDGAIIFGLSMGGMIAQEFAMRHPHRVRGLFLCATIPPVPDFIATPHGVGLAASIVMPPSRDVRRPTREQIRHGVQTLQAFAAPGYQAPDSRLEEFAAQNLVRATGRYGAFCQARAINAWRGPHRLSMIYTPTVIIQGGRDRLVVPANGHRLAELIPGAKYIELPEVGHLIPWEATETLSQLVLENSAPRAARPQSIS